MSGTELEVRNSLIINKLQNHIICSVNCSHETNSDYLVNARITFAEICRKKIEPMKESERTRTIKRSLQKYENIFLKSLPFVILI